MRVAGIVGAELTHLIGLATLGVLKSYGEYHVIVKTAFERDIAELGVERIFRGAEHPRTLNLLIVLAAGNAITVEGCHCCGDIGNVTYRAVLGRDLVI